MNVCRKHTSLLFFLTTFLSLNHIGHIFGGDWEVVDFIGKLVVGLDGSDVRVDEHGFDTGFVKGLQGL